jgi:predicted nucleic acid-binding protein
MIEFFDTTVLLAAMLEDDKNHEFGAKALENAAEGYTSVLCVTECYATLTRGRLGIRLSPADASRLIRHNFQQLSLVSLSSAEYVQLVDSAGPAGASGGTIYDLLVLACARKAKADRIYTLCPKHHALLAPDLAERMVAPEP